MRAVSTLWGQVCQTNGALFNVLTALMPADDLWQLLVDVSV